MLSCGDKNLGMEIRYIPQPLPSDFQKQIKKFVEETVAKHQWVICHKDVPVEVRFTCFHEPPKNIPKWKKDAVTFGLLPPLNVAEPWSELIKAFLSAMKGLVYESEKQVFRIVCESACSPDSRFSVEVTKFFTNISDIKAEISKQRKRSIAKK